MFEDRLKNLRKKKGVTQTQVAEGIFVSRSLIAKFETGAAYPNKETLEKLALYFDIPISELVDQEETTLVTVDMKDVSEKINLGVLIFIFVITLIYSIVVFIPMFQGKRYVYPIPPGQNYPNMEYFFTSIFWASFKNGNPIGLISFLFSFALTCLSSICIFLRKKGYSVIIRLITYSLFFIDTFVCFAAIICCFSYIS